MEQSFRVFDFNVLNINKLIDDSSESEYIYKRANKYSVTQPFNYWWYDPYLYGLNSVYIPTFYSYTTPYVELALILP